MSEKRILLASVLKPINDTRMFEKLGLSLSKLPDTEIHVVGFQAPLPITAPANVYFHALFRFRRLSYSRYTAPRVYFAKLQELKPDLIICCTHELLLPSLRYCKSTGAKLVYDVQENYALNLTSQRNYPFLVRQFLARRVRSAESEAAPSIAHFLLAEYSYAEELAFIKGREYSFILNKYKANATYTLPSIPVEAKGPLRLMYAGTIAEMYGIFEAVALAEKLYQLDSTTTLTIIGYSARQHTLQQLQRAIHDKPYIKLIGGDSLVPHEQILQEIGKSNIGLLPYQPNPSTFRCIPTKLYEYMAYALSVIIQQNPLWQSLIERSAAGISIDFKEPQPEILLQRIRQQPFYTSGVPQDVFWKSEEEKLLPIIKSILQR